MMQVFELSKVAGRLESLEESILFRLLDRAQYHRNLPVYQSGRFPLGDNQLSLLNYMLRFGEETFAVLGRYTIAEERPFFSNLPTPAKGMGGENVGLAILDINDINLTSEISEAYQALLEQITLPGEDGHFGTTAEYDIAALQAIARRIHYGAFYVAECKYRENSSTYDTLVRAQDTEAILALLTRKEVEDTIIERIKKKCDQIQSISNPEIRRSVDSSLIAQFYFDAIIPLTKVGEVAYLMRRVR